MSARGTFPLTFLLKVQGDTEIANKFRQLATSMNQLSPAAQKVAQSSNQASTSLKSTGQAATQSSTGIKSYGGALTSLGSANTQARTSTDAFTGSLTNFSKTNTAAVGGLNNTNTVVKGLVPTMGSMGTETEKTGGKMQRLTDMFRGNRGLIFSVTMLSSGISEAISMYQGFQDASDKLADAQQKVNDLEERGMENTKEYGDAVKDLSDAQRGYNFIQRFTIQSFADLAPMSLMLTSSLLDMTGRVGGLSAAKAKLAGVIPKITNALNVMFTAMMSFTIRHPLLLLLTALVAVALAIITNFGGLRDRINEVGVSIGNAIGPLKGFLEWLGQIGNQAADTANSYLQFGQTAVAATTDVEKQVLKTGDATKLSYDQQIALMAKLGEDSKNVSMSLGAHLKQQQQDQEAHKAKYAEFVEAMQTGNSDIMQSLGLTADEFTAFSEQMQQETEALDEAFGAMVESIIDNWSRFGERQSDAATSLIDQINELETEILDLTHQTWDMDDDDKVDEMNHKIGQLSLELGLLRGTVSFAAESAAQDFTMLAETGKKALDQFSLEVLGGNFAGAINTLTHAMDEVPEKYQANFSQIDAIIGNTALTNRQKVAQIIADYGSLEQAFKPLINGAYELSLAQAEAAAGLDELSVAARSNLTDMSQAGTAWETFLNSLTSAQKELPIIQDLIARVNAGAITHAEALAEAEAAGVAWSKTLGKDVVQSIQNVEKSFIDLGDGTSAMVANVNGQMVNLGRVSNTELGNMSNDLTGVQSSMSDTAKTAKSEIENEATAAVGVFGKDGKFHFGTVVQGANTVIDIFKAINNYSDTYIVKGASAKVETFGKTMTTTGKTVKTETDAWGTAFESFKTKAISVIDSIAQRLKGTDLSNLLPSLGFAEGAETGGGGASFVPFVDTALANQKMDEFKAKADLITSQVSAAFVTMETSIKGTLTRIGAVFPTAFTQLYTFAVQNTGKTIEAFVILQQQITTVMGDIKTVIGTQFLAIIDIINAFGPVLTALHTQFSNFSTSVSTYMSSMTNSVGNGFIKPVTQMIAAFSPVLTALQTQFSNFSTSVNTYMTGMTTAIGNFAKSSTTSFNTVNTAVKSTHTALSSMSTSVSTYMSGMSKQVSAFGTASQTAFNKTKTSADNATKGVQALQKAINSLKDKTVTITVRYRTVGKPGMEHGGAFIAAAQHGFSGIVDRPTTMGGVRMGEGFKPELVTVQPLTRGTGNHGGPTVSSGGAAGGSQPIINNITVVLDGRVIQRFVEKTALNSYGLQV